MPYQDTTEARAAWLQVAAERATEDPRKLAKATRVVRAALDRQRLTLADVAPASVIRGCADYHLSRLAESASELTDEQLARLADIVRPVLGHVERRPVDRTEAA